MKKLKKDFYNRVSKFLSFITKHFDTGFSSCNQIKKNVLSSEDGSVILTQIKKDVWVHTTYTEIQGNKVGANGLIIW